MADLIDELRGRLSDSDLAELITFHAKDKSAANAKPYIYLLAELYQKDGELKSIHSSFSGADKDTIESWIGGEDDV